MDADLPLIAAVQLAVAQSPLAVELDLSSELIPHAIEAAIAFIVSKLSRTPSSTLTANKLRVKTWIEDGRIFTEIEDNGIGGAAGLRKLRNRARQHGARSRSTVHQVSEPSYEQRYRSQLERIGASDVGGSSRSPISTSGQMKPASHGSDSPSREDRFLRPAAVPGEQRYTSGRRRLNARHHSGLANSAASCSTS